MSVGCHELYVGSADGSGYMVESNKEHGEGRSDIVVYDAGEGRAAVFEVKNSKSLKDEWDSNENRKR